MTQFLFLKQQIAEIEYDTIENYDFIEDESAFFIETKLTSNEKLRTIKLFTPFVSILLIIFDFKLTCYLTLLSNFIYSSVHVYVRLHEKSEARTFNGNYALFFFYKLVS
jgi:hypothetical protein